MKFIYLLVVAVLVAAFAWVYKNGLLDFKALSTYKEGEVSIRGEQFRVEVADTPTKREVGLGGKEPLEQNEGMLFIFETLRSRSFWMRDVTFPIDIIWIAEESVVGFDIDVQPEPGVPLHKLTHYRSIEPVDMVLEVPAGTVDRIGIIAGDSVSYRIKE